MLSDPIRHIVVLMLENNSFDRMLGCMTSAYPQLCGVDPKAPFTNPDYPNNEHLYAQLPDSKPSVAVDPAHDLDDVIRQVDRGHCMGFVSDLAQHKPQAPEKERYQIMSYFDRGSLPVLHTLAEDSIICDHWFSSVPGPTWPNRFFVNSGTSLGHIDMPSPFSPLDGFALYDQPTVFQRLSEKQIDWRIYFGDVPQTLLMARQLVYPEHYRLMIEFQIDAAKSEADFPQYVFIEPCYFFPGQNDQHPPTDVRHGEQLIAKVYNAIRSNEELWKSTLFVLLYDEHGGFCDHVAPPATVAPDEHTKDFSFTQLGVRVPALLISPWLDPGVLSTDFDHTSLLKYLTDKWDLGPLGNRVPQANSFAPELLKLASPRQDCVKTVASSEPEANEPETALNAHQVALAGFTHYLEINYTKPGDHTIAAHSKAMASGIEELSLAVSERIGDFLKKGLLTQNPETRPWGS